ncbi:hypothetical protein, partial [Akkermansia sp.]|uniref:hypothetical protein n=1 Tax=Akkermansia sp. TaxID=1872421 RepID=UPI003AB502B3
LEQDFRNKLFNDYFKKFEGPKQAGSFKHNVQHIKDNMSKECSWDKEGRQKNLRSFAAPENG